MTFDYKLGGTRIPVAQDVSCLTGLCKVDYRDLLDGKDMPK